MQFPEWARRFLQYEACVDFNVGGGMARIIAWGEAQALPYLRRQNALQASKNALKAYGKTHPQAAAALEERKERKKWRELLR